VLGDKVTSFDLWVDHHAQRWRGRPLVDAVSHGASAVGDHGLAWLVIGLARARRPGRRGPAIWSVLFTGAVIPLLNSTLKSSVGRVRPDRSGAPIGAVRIPRTASFPSGHTLAAWCAATVLADGDPLAPAFYGLAAAISYSRVHVRLHHASDVLGGMVLGIALGRIGRRLRPFGAR
jgi:undecaprenyl-diphosphatase